jgi:hypothetical protein
MGRLIPAGTGLANYQFLDLDVDKPDVELDDYPMEEGPIVVPTGDEPVAETAVAEG